MVSPPVPRLEVFDVYWRFASERQRIYELRLAQRPSPWTDDAILQDFKFCNVFRAADRVSQYLIRYVAYGDQDTVPADRLFQIVLFRLFSRTSTWEGICDYLGERPRIEHLAAPSLEAALDATRERQGGLYTAAFILCANDAYGQGRKHLNHVELLRDMFVRQQLGSRLPEASSLREVFSLLREFPLIGDFMAYQLAIDLNYTDIVNFSENDFTRPGPGALRGMKKVFTSFGTFSPSDVILWMVDRQQSEFERRGLAFHGLRGRLLHAIDGQGLFCEVDKYCREAFPELKSNRRQIKSRFRPSGPVEVPFFPPKWGIPTEPSSTTMDDGAIPLTGHALA